MARSGSSVVARSMPRKLRPARSTPTGVDAGRHRMPPASRTGTIEVGERAPASDGIADAGLACGGDVVATAQAVGGVVLEVLVGAATDDRGDVAVGVVGVGDAGHSRVGIDASAG